MPPATFSVGLEIAPKRTFAVALDWPGWCRSGRDEASALAALLACAPRYARAIASARLGFHAPQDLSALRIVERQPGSATTDFGAPDAAFLSDAAPLGPAEQRRLAAILRACWRAFDKTVEAAEGIELKKGPRGGGRELSAIVAHVIGGDESYLRALGWMFKLDETAPQAESLAQIRAAVPEALAASARGEIPARGPRGGQRWSPRRYTRRAAWHILDHTWEIEDRC